MSVNFSGVDHGLKDAQYVFEEALKDLAPCCGKYRIQGVNANAKKLNDCCGDVGCNYGMSVQSCASDRR